MKAKLEALATLCLETDRSSFVMSFRKKDKMWILTFTSSGQLPVFKDTDPEVVVTRAIAEITLKRIQISPEVKYTL